ncbi:MAG: ArsA family ATPase [Myxococcaceae bacterium]
MAALFSKRLLIVSGKGGVGKSSIAAALGLLSAREGKRTLICEVNSQERISTFLGKEPVGAELGRLEDNLWAVDVRPAEAMREYALMILKFQAVYKAVFENRLVRYFLRFIPSLQELVILGKILFHLQEKRPDGSWRFERIILDAPATGHAITFLSVPKVLLDTVPPGQMAREAEKMRDLLVDRKTTAMVLVSLPEEMPVNETLELHDTLSKQVNIATGAVILNGFIPDRFNDGDLAEIEAKSPELLPLARGHRAREKISRESCERLAKGIGVPVITLPRLHEKQFGRAQIEKIAEKLATFVNQDNATGER